MDIKLHSWKFLFCPTDVELVNHIISKVQRLPKPGPIHEIQNFYVDHNPFTLAAVYPKEAKEVTMDDHHFFYCRPRRGESDNDKIIKVKQGYYQAFEEETVADDNGRPTGGMVRKMRFCVYDQDKKNRGGMEHQTDWVVHEFLVDDSIMPELHRFDNWVLCKLFRQSKVSMEEKVQLDAISAFVQHIDRLTISSSSDDENEEDNEKAGAEMLGEEIASGNEGDKTYYGWKKLTPRGKLCFCATNAELLDFLIKRIKEIPIAHHAIYDAFFYKEDPWGLDYHYPQIVKQRTQEGVYYFFSPPFGGGEGEDDEYRPVENGSGFWKVISGEMVVTDRNGQPTAGTMKEMVFYIGERNSGQEAQSDWYAHEFHWNGDELFLVESQYVFADWVLCKLFLKITPEDLGSGDESDD